MTSGAWGNGERPRDPDATWPRPSEPAGPDVFRAYPGGMDAPTHAYPALQRPPEGQGAYGARPYGRPTDGPRARGAEQYPGGIDDTRPLPRFGEPPTLPPAGPAPAGGAEEGGSRSVARHGAGMALGSVISRVTGFVRTAAIGAAIGAAAIGNSYSLANTLPGMVYELLLGGVLASTVVPLLVRARDRDPDRGQEYAQRLLSLAALFLAGATVVAVLCAPLFTALLTNDRTAPSDRHLVTTLAYLLLPMIFFYGMAALFAAVLNTHGRFAMPTFAPIFNNIVVITMCGAFFIVPVINKDETASLSGTQIALLGLGTTAGIVVQTAALLPSLRRVGFRWRWRGEFRKLHLSDLARVSSWMLAYVVLGQIAQVVVFRLAQMAADAGGGAAGPAIYNNAFLIFMMAHGIIAVSIITVLMPRMSAASAQARHADLADHLSIGTRLTSVVLVPATVAYLILGRPLAVTLFQWGNYHHEEAVATGGVIAVAGLGLIAFAISQLQLFAFYSMRDTRTPALLIVPVVVLRIAIDVFVYVVLPATLVAAGLMAGNAVSYVLAAALGYFFLRRRLGQGVSHVSNTLGRVAIAGVIAAVPTAALLVTLTAIWGDGKLASLAQLVVGGLTLGLAYVGAATWLRIREVRELLAMVRTRLGR